MQRSIPAPPHAEVEHDHCVLDFPKDAPLFHTRRLKEMAAPFSRSDATKKLTLD
jgi:hypothetical protein